MVGAFVVARVTRSVDRVAGIGIGAVLVVPDLEVVAKIVYVDIAIDHQALGEILQPRHPQPKMPLGVGDRQFLSSFLLAIFGDIFPREGIGVPAPEGAEKLEGSAPPRAPALGTPFIGLRGRNVQDARKFALVFVLHRAWIRLPTHAQPTTRTQIGDLYAATVDGTQELFDLAAQPNR